MGACIFSLCYFNSSNYRSLFSTSFSQRLSLLGPGHYSTTLLVPVSDREKKSLKHIETIWCVLSIVSMCRNTFSVFNSVVIFRHCFTGNGKVSYILVTISDCFPNKTI